jgi:hypothetical protein
MSCPFVTERNASNLPSSEKIVVFGGAAFFLKDVLCVDFDVWAESSHPGTSRTRNRCLLALHCLLGRQFE